MLSEIGYSIMHDSVRHSLAFAARYLEFTNSFVSAASGQNIPQKLHDHLSPPQIGGLYAETVAQTLYGQLIHVVHEKNCKKSKNAPKILFVAPAGHKPSIFCDLIESMLKFTDVYMVDWHDVKHVPQTENSHFDLDGNTQHIIEFIRYFSEPVHVIALSQSGVPTLAATAILAANKDKTQPCSITLMGVPIDTRTIENGATRIASLPIQLIESFALSSVPAGYAGAGRRIYSGESQSVAERFAASRDVFNNPTSPHALRNLRFAGNPDDSRAITAELFLDVIWQKYKTNTLPKGEMRVGGEIVDLAAITGKTAIITITGGCDRTVPPPHTKPVHDLCTGIPKSQHRTLNVPDATHSDLYSGKLCKYKIIPRLGGILDELRAS